MCIISVSHSPRTLESFHLSLSQLISSPTMTVSEEELPSFVFMALFPNVIKPLESSGRNFTLRGDLLAQAAIALIQRSTVQHQFPHHPVQPGLVEQACALSTSEPVYLDDLDVLTRLGACFNRPNDWAATVLAVLLGRQQLRNQQATPQSISTFLNRLFEWRININTSAAETAAVTIVETLMDIRPEETMAALFSLEGYESRVQALLHLVVSPQTAVAALAATTKALSMAPTSEGFRHWVDQVRPSKWETTLMAMLFELNGVPERPVEISSVQSSYAPIFEMARL
ncbi:hypothetical protein J8273_4102 [Carpediemonas membranifera]|uniref:Uncharacterized protein n=1 Tax=Carpediemonas membranifera TaxID=201153 RepID=A0A8J6BCB6_9EUKA|nr:hypothetical protein J8273_4102 [Carpediemonas membranifera]|eukprot:KAG9394437.1 hypothetical protein J8273_4102 [Carpediemonas membranifera]